MVPLNFINNFFIEGLHKFETAELSHKVKLISLLNLIFKSALWSLEAEEKLEL